MSIHHSAYKLVDEKEGLGGLEDLLDAQEMRGSLLHREHKLWQLLRV